MMDGMKEVSEAVSKTKAYYYPFVETEPKQSEGLLMEISKQASVVVTCLLYTSPSPRDRG